MNEMALNLVEPSKSILERVFGTKRNRKSSAFYGYSLTIIAIGVGWLLRDRALVNPEHGLGYWLGIVGGSMMLLLLIYPLRKRIRLLQFLGRTSHWFSLHMILGVLGPVLVLYHSNFQLGSFNSRIALYCMLLVAGSGVIGRELYARIHRGLYGRKMDLKELQNDLTRSLRENHGLAALLPDLAARLEVLSDKVQGDRITGTLSTGASLAWTVNRHFIRLSLLLTARRELRVRAKNSPAVARDYRRLRRTSSSYIRNFVRLTGRIAEFTLCERLFSVWHVLHMPLFFMMVLSSTIHVLAVHMY